MDNNGSVDYVRALIDRGVMISPDTAQILIDRIDDLEENVKALCLVAGQEKRAQEGLLDRVLTLQEENARLAAQLASVSHVTAA